MQRATSASSFNLAPWSAFQLAQIRGPFVDRPWVVIDSIPLWRRVPMLWLCWTSTDSGKRVLARGKLS
ncbi:hypothetical protein LshimejAT787_1005030 [Lyophyllum shimeji]|uniref:Uncharacterized protein n=1 Tax=Lyophyllum shimeji TaxID=47721 RepID=A0A9P3UQQ7_LYOSH|nr:hypothetical protein LshimejAT787_1005030 [Lyophyllum shimeji]